MDVVTGVGVGYVGHPLAGAFGIVMLTIGDGLGSKRNRLVLP